jgi:hypothetical protein
VNPDLLKLLGIDESDLAANRAGQMGEHQQARLRKDQRRLTIAAAGGGVFFALLMLLLLLEGNSAWPVMLAIGAGWVLLCYLFASQDQRGREAEVYCLTGPYSLSKRTVGDGQGIANVSLWLQIDGKECLLPTIISLDVDRWKAALGDGDLRVYAFDAVKPKMLPQVVGIDPAAG